MRMTLAISLFILLIVTASERFERSAHHGLETYVETTARETPELYEGGAYAEPPAVERVAYDAPSD